MYDINWGSFQVSLVVMRKICFQTQLQETSNILESTKAALDELRTTKSSDFNSELRNTLDQLKDSHETNTALQLQLDSLNSSHQLLKSSYDELITSNRNLERRSLDSETLLLKYKSELDNLQRNHDKLSETEVNLTKLLEMEKLQNKSHKLQNEKDARCILDLNRQVKEMERIIARKHPDSVSALIVAAKSDQVDTNMSARKVLEDRIKSLEQEASARDQQSAKVCILLYLLGKHIIYRLFLQIFLEIQEKFGLMKNKYESHIDDLELHVSDLKNQLRRKVDSYDVYTQTKFEGQKIPEKDTRSVAVQTKLQEPRSKPEQKQPKPSTASKKPEKEDTHLLATIRGLQADLANKDKAMIKLQKDLEEMRKTNKRLQKEREGSLRNLSERKEFRSYPEKLAAALNGDGVVTGDLNTALAEELKTARSERDNMRSQLCRIEEDYQNLKAKRLYDVSEN